MPSNKSTIKSTRPIYTVHAFRWGDHENHSYIVGVYDKKHEALKNATAEEEYRGGKYSCEVKRWDLNLRNKGNDPGMPSSVVKSLTAKWF